MEAIFLHPSQLWRGGGCSRSEAFTRLEKSPTLHKPKRNEDWKTGCSFFLPAPPEKGSFIPRLAYFYCPHYVLDLKVIMQYAHYQEKWLSKMCVLEGFMAAFTIFSKRFSVNIHPPSCAHTTHETGENNDKSSNSQVLTKILNYELIHKNQQQPQDLRHRVVPNSYLTVNAALFCVCTLCFGSISILRQRPRYFTH